MRRQRSVELFKTIFRSLSGPVVEVPSFDSRRDISFDIAASIEIDPVWHQGVLESRSEKGRLEQIEELLRAVLEGRREDEADLDGEDQGWTGPA